MNAAARHERVEMICDIDARTRTQVLSVVPTAHSTELSIVPPRRDCLKRPVTITVVLQSDTSTRTV